MGIKGIVSWWNMATDARLTKTERNALFELIRQHHFDPTEFRWTEETTEEIRASGGYSKYLASRLTHNPTGYYIVFGGLSWDFSPSATQRVGYERRPESLYLRDEIVSKWLRRVREEYDAPDLWATIGKERVLATAASSEALDNRPFGPNELQLINTKLDEIKSYLLEGQAFDAEQAEFIKREFAYLRESATRMGRKDWLNIFLGGLVGTIFTLGLEPEKARGLFALAGTALQSLWGMAQGLLR